MYPSCAHLYEAPKAGLPARDAAPVSRPGGAQGSAASSPARLLPLFLPLGGIRAAAWALAPRASRRRGRAGLDSGATPSHLGGAARPAQSRPPPTHPPCRRPPVPRGTESWNGGVRGCSLRAWSSGRRLWARQLEPAAGAAGSRRSDVCLPARGMSICHRGPPALPRRQQLAAGPETAPPFVC